MLVSFIIMVLSSVIAAWSDISSTISSLTGAWNGTAPAAALSNEFPKSLTGTLNIGYFWMFSNCLASAAYVCPTGLWSSQSHPSTGAGDAQAYQGDGIQRLGHNVLQQLAPNSSIGHLLLYHGRLGFGKFSKELVSWHVVTSIIRSHINRFESAHPNQKMSCSLRWSSQVRPLCLSPILLRGVCEPQAARHIGTHCSRDAITVN